MTKQEIMKCFEQIQGWIKGQSDKLDGYIGNVGTLTVMTRPWPDGGYYITLTAARTPIDGIALLPMFIDGNTHESKLAYNNPDQVCLDYIVEVIKAWPKIKTEITDLIGECAASEKRRREREADGEKRLCDSVTEFKL